MTENESVAPEKEESSSSPQHDLRTKEALRARERKEKKNVKFLDEWYEINPDKGNRKGGKIIAYAKTKTGVMSQYVGRENEKPEFVKQIKKQGKLRKAS